MIKKLLIICGLFFTIPFVLALIFLRPVPIVPEKDCLVVKGSVVRIEEGSSFDVVFTLHNDKRKFYINRGLESGLTMDSLRKRILFEEVTIKYPDYFSFGNSIVHLSKLEHGNEVVYSELKE